MNRTDAEALAQSYEIDIFFCSALKGEGVDELFETLTRKTVSKLAAFSNAKDRTSFRLSKSAGEMKEFKKNTPKIIPAPRAGNNAFSKCVLKNPFLKTRF